MEGLIIFISVLYLALCYWILYVFKVESDYEIVYKPSGVDNGNEIKEIG